VRGFLLGPQAAGPQKFLIMIKAAGPQGVKHLSEDLESRAPATGHPLRGHRTPVTPLK